MYPHHKCLKQKQATYHFPSNNQIRPCFRSNPINHLYLSMYMYVVLIYEINVFKLNKTMSSVD